MKIKKKTIDDISKEKAIELLWEAGELSWKLSEPQKIIKKSIEEDSTKISVVMCARRLGKCLAEGTMVMTPTGNVPIEALKQGDSIYGYNEHGQVELTKVVAVEYQGEKDVVDLVNHSKLLATCTEDHRWLFRKDPRRNRKTAAAGYFEKSIKERKEDESIIRRFVKKPMGPVREPHAYALGALLGDGCSRESVYDKKISMSSETHHVPEKVAQVLGAKYYYKNSEKNYTWTITNNKKQDRGYWHLNNGQIDIDCHYYKDWCKGKYAHEKIVDVSVIKTWDRESCLQFLAGLIDTDGGVTDHGKEMSITFGCQSKIVVDTFAMVFSELFQYWPTVSIDNRAKYVNGPVYYLSIKNNLFNKRALKELDPYIVTPRKKWKTKYENYLENNSNPDWVGFKVKNKRKMRCWDIQVGNSTSLYLLANGLVTHNSYLMLTMAVETCLKTSNAIVKFVFPRQKAAKRNVVPELKKILEDCPPYLKGEFKVADLEWVFPNGSKIQLAGCDSGNIENIRGGNSHLNIVDEAGFADDIKYAVRSVLGPTTKLTGGRTILVSTPSRSENHEFIQEFALPYMAEDRIRVFSIYDNPQFTEAIIKDALDDYPNGEKDPEFRREYMCEIIRSTEHSILPSFNTEAEKEIIKSDYVRPVYYDPYVSFDIGGVDLTAILFGYYDYENACLVIEDELIADGSTNTEILAAQIKEKERTLWENPLDKSQIEPYMRVIDTNNKILATDLLKLHGLLFTPVKKDKKQAAINALDVAIARRQIVIHPRCTHLLYHMKFAMWNNAQTDFKKLKDSPSGKIRGGHADALAAMIYMHRSVIKSKNPFPSGYNVPSGSNYFKSLKSPLSSGGGLGDFMKKVLKKR